MAVVLLGLALFLFPGRMAGGVLVALAVVWVLAAVVLLGRFLVQPSTAAVAKRADRVLGLDDDLLVLSELPADQSAAWREASVRDAGQKLSSRPLSQAWPLKLSKAALLTSMLLLAATVGVGWLGLGQLAMEQEKLANEQAAQDERVAAAVELIEDWQEFVKLTDDEELKKMFTEAAALKEALQQKDPMAAMLEMNRIEEKIGSLQEAIAKESLDAQAGEMAESLESIEGMSAMSAALRNRDYAQAAAEAEKLEAALAKNPDGKSAVRREEAVSEMLANQAKSAASRGKENLSEALSQLSKSASQASRQGGIPNEEMKNSSRSLRNEFSQQSSRQNRGRAASLANEQLQNLRRRLRGEGESRELPFPSLCQSCLGSKPGGNKAGTSPGGDPMGEQTDLAAAGTQDNVTGVQGDGETETRTISSNDGSGSAASGSKPTAFSDYIELSRQAVADESLPLAHRQVIRAYFERIRPIGDQ